MAKHSQTPSRNVPVPDDSEDRYAAWLGEALALAAEAVGSGDVPVGAIVGGILARTGIKDVLGQKMRDQKRDQGPTDTP